MGSIRQHVNPLGRFFQQPLELPSLTALFPQPHQPLHLDIGCARGRFLMDMAALYPQRNHLGLEIRRPLVERAENQRQRRQLHNLHYLFCNVTVSLASLTHQLAPEQLQLVTIQFPDPWFKRKHHKRRLLQDSLLNTLSAAMAPGALLFLQSDVGPLMEEVAISGSGPRMFCSPAAGLVAGESPPGGHGAGATGAGQRTARVARLLPSETPP